MSKIAIVSLLFFTLFAQSQSYVEKKTRHRFGEMYLGMGYMSSLGGNTKFFNIQNQLDNLKLNSISGSRLLIGGTHFWGHADFYVSIPFSFKAYRKENQTILHNNNVETGFKFYPWRIENGKIRPFLGVAWTPYLFEQDNSNFQFSDGPRLDHTSFPLLGGLTFRLRKHLFNLGASWNYANKQDYYISRTDEVKISTPPFQVSLSYGYVFDTTIRAEDEWESGETKLKTEILAENGGLNDFYLSAGFSSAFWLGNSSYNEELRPYMSNFPASLALEFGLGYHLHKSDMNLLLNYRGMASSNSAYGTEQAIRRKAYGFEVTKNFWDYNGFVPFFGAIVSNERLRFREDFENQRTFNIAENRTSIGLSFGWDIRPNRIQTWLIRSNFRFYPRLQLGLDGQRSISFSNIEANFVQLVFNQERILSRKLRANNELN
ncbi:MAG: hypothetical protein ACFB0A_15200 [Croceivirga sp.]